MKRSILLSSILLLSSVWAVAQYESQPSTSSANSQSSSGSSNMTVEGCLAGSEGSYNLTDKSGTTYQLTGDTAKLQAHVGHTVQVMGKMGGPMAGKQSGSMSAPSDAQPTLAVTAFKHVATSCSATR